AQAQADYAGALREYRASLEIFQRLVVQAPDPRLQVDLAIAHEKIGNALLAQGDVAGALKEYGQDLEITERVANPGNRRSMIDLAIAHERMADALERAGRTPEGVAHAQLAQALRRAAAGEKSAQ